MKTAFVLAAALLSSSLPVHARPRPRTVVGIDGKAFTINGRKTYEGQVWDGYRVEGLLMNTRVGAVMRAGDDAFLEGMATFRNHGVLAISLNLQSGPACAGDQPDPSSTSGALRPDGRLDPAHQAQLVRILDRADALGMVAIVGLFDAGADQVLKDERAIKRAVSDTTRWLLGSGYRHVLLEIANEVDGEAYDHAILRYQRVLELIKLARSIRVGGRRLLVGTSFGGGAIPNNEVLAVSDFVLLHGQGVKDPAAISQMVQVTRDSRAYHEMPILFTADDTQEFKSPDNHMVQALSAYASWGYAEPVPPEDACTPDSKFPSPRQETFARQVRKVTGIRGP